MKYSKLLFFTFFILESAWSLCPDSVKTKYEYSESVLGHCAYAVPPMSVETTNFIDGDLIWLSNDVEVRVGSAPQKFVALDDGIMLTYENGKYVSLNFWSATNIDSKIQVCLNDIRVRDLVKNKVKLETLKDKGMKVSTGTSVKVYFSECRDSGDQRVYVDLTEQDKAVLEKYSPYGHLSNDLTDPKTNATLPTILGRDEIVDKLIARVNSTGNKRSILLWGPAGVGKTAIAYRLATRIMQSRENIQDTNSRPIPDWLKEWKVYVIDLSLINTEGLAGVSDQKMSEIVKAASGKKVILLMDEIHQLIGIGTGKDDPIDVTEVMKTNLANGQLSVIGTLTDQKNEMSLLQTKKAFYSRFTRIKVNDPPPFVLDIIYKYKAKKLLRYKNVDFPDELIPELISLTHKYVATEHHPRVGLTILEDILGAELSPKNKDPNSKEIYKITSQDLRKAIGEYGNVRTLQESDGSNEEEQSFEEIVFNFKDKIRKKYIGNNSAVEAVESVLFNIAAQETQDKRPDGMFLFLGPSGVGKSYLAKTTADMLKMKRKLYPMSSYGSEADVNSFIGAPEGYIGYNEAGGELIRWVNQNPDSVLIFDEIDKAHPKVLEAFMINLMEEGWVKSKGGAEASCANCMIFYTSNYALDLINAFDYHRRPDIDKPVGDWDGMNIPLSEVPKTEDELKNKILNNLINSKQLGSYFVGRINLDNIVIFHHLNREEAKKIASLEIKKVLKKYDYKIEVSDKVLNYIKTRGLDFRFGARTMRNLAESLLKTKINRAIVEAKIRAKRERRPFKIEKITVDLGVKTNPNQTHPEIKVKIVEMR